MEILCLLNKELINNAWRKKESSKEEKVFLLFLPFMLHWIIYWGSLTEPQHDKTNKMTCTPSLIRDFTVHMKKPWVLKLPIERTAKTLIRLGGCQGWSESSLGTHAILLVLSCCGSTSLLEILEDTHCQYIPAYCSFVTVCSPKILN